MVLAGKFVKKVDNILIKSTLLLILKKGHLCAFTRTLT
jgi:hypothetical protein